MADDHQRTVEQRLAFTEDRVHHLERSVRQLLDLVALVGGTLAKRAERILEESRAATS